MYFLSNGQYAVVDLASGKVTEEPLEEDLLRKTLGGVGTSLELYRRYEEQTPLIFGTGLLTGTLAPAACLGFATAKSPRTGRIVHVPFGLHSAVDLKLSGFDFIVVLGESASPKYLWLHDGLIDVKDGIGLWGGDVWQTVDNVRKSLGEDMIQVFAIGKAGESQSMFAQIGINYWNSADEFGLGAVMGQKKLKALAVRGLGSLDANDIDGLVDDAVALAEDLRDLPVARLRGLAGVSGAFSDQGYGEWIEPLVHRHSACFNCPAACNTYVKYNESPSELTQNGIAEPGLLITNFAAMLGLRSTGYGAEDAARQLEGCSRLGLDPLAVGRRATAGAKVLPADLERLISDAADEYAPWPWSGETASSAIQSPFSLWSVPDETVGGRLLTASGWLRNNGVGYLLGICPIFLSLAPEVSAERLVALLNRGTGWSVNAEELEQAANRVAQIP